MKDIRPSGPRGTGANYIDPDFRQDISYAQSPHFFLPGRHGRSAREIKPVVVGSELSRRLSAILPRFLDEESAQADLAPLTAPGTQSLPKRVRPQFPSFFAGAHRSAIVVRRFFFLFALVLALPPLPQELQEADNTRAGGLGAVANGFFQPSAHVAGKDHVALIQACRGSKNPERFAHVTHRHLAHNYVMVVVR